MKSNRVKSGFLLTVAWSACAMAGVNVSFNDVRTAADFSFGAEAWDRKVYVVYGGADCGPCTSGWARVEQVGVAPAGATSLTGVAMPAGFDADALVMRALVERDPTTQDYAQDGLVAHYDALDNAGLGQHAETLTEWVDLKGANNLPLVATDAVGADYLSIGPTAHQTANPLFTDTSKSLTLEGSFCVISFPAATSSLSGINVVAVPVLGRLSLELRLDMKPVRFVSADMHYRWPTNPYASLSHFQSSGCYEYCTLRPALMGNYSATAIDGSCQINGESRGCAINDYVEKVPPTGLASNLIVGNVYGTLRFRSVRVYSRTLSDEECALNSALDLMRYEGGARVPLFQTSTLVCKPVPLAVTQVTQSDGLITALATQFTATNYVRRMFLGWSRRDAGGNVRDWTNRVELGSVPADVASQSFDIPSAASQALRTNGYRLFLERVPTASDYVRTDLLVQYDALENAGFGQHDATAVTWKDLAGSRDLALVASDAVSNDFVRIGPTIHKTTGDLFGASSAPATLEASFAVASYGLTSLYGPSVVAVPKVMSLALEKRANMRPIRFMQVQRVRWAGSDFGNLDAFKNSGKYAYCSFRPRLMVYNTNDDSIRVNDVARYYAVSDYDITVATDYTLSVGNEDGELDFRAIRIYGRTLDPDEQKLNYDIDQVRFEGADTLCFAEATSFVKARRGLMIIVQ